MLRLSAGASNSRHQGAGLVPFLAFCAFFLAALLSGFLPFSGKGRFRRPLPFCLLPT
ncbi:MAG: hypothetical protein V2G51_02090 [bacterium JZ-2024 1]